MHTTYSGHTSTNTHLRCGRFVTRDGARVLPDIASLLNVAVALMVAPPWAFLLVSGYKVWEIRKKDIRFRGRVAIALIGSGMLWGEVEVVDSFFMTMGGLCLPSSIDKHRIPVHDLSTYASTGGGIYARGGGGYVIVMRNAVRYPHPIPYEHNLGAQLLVRLDRPGLEGRVINMG